MAYPPQRSKNLALDEGATDGGFIKERPNTEAVSANTSKILATRRSLSNLGGYSAAVYPSRDNPGK